MQLCLKRRHQLLQPFAGARRDRHDGSILQHRPFKHLGHVGRDQLQPVRVPDQIRLRQRDDATTNLQKVEDRQVLPRLGHHPFVGRDDEQRRVDPPHPGQHVLDEVAVPRHVDDAHRLAFGKGKPGEAQIDGHLPLLLLSEPIGVDPGQGFHQGGLAMVHVTGGADDAHLDLFGELRKLLEARQLLLQGPDRSVGLGRETLHERQQVLLQPRRLVLESR